ncbi:MAG: recombinase family protein [Candidatus Desulfofervidus auxilii]|nr:recombinase family protein [Candidatus Desulfofervidus auxilii]
MFGLDKETIKLIYELSEQYGVRKVVKILNQKGVLSKKGKPIYKRMIQEILKQDFDFIDPELKERVKKAQKDRVRNMFKDAFKTTAIMTYWCPKYDCFFTNPETCFYKIYKKGCIENCNVGKKLVEKFPKKFKEVKRKLEALSKKVFMPQEPILDVSLVEEIPFSQLDELEI